MPRFRRNPTIASRFVAASRLREERDESQTACSFTLHERWAYALGPPPPAAATSKQDSQQTVPGLSVTSSVQTTSSSSTSVLHTAPTVSSVSSGFSSFQREDRGGNLLGGGPTPSLSGGLPADEYEQDRLVETQTEARLVVFSPNLKPRLRMGRLYRLQFRGCPKRYLLVRITESSISERPLSVDLSLDRDIAERAFEQNQQAFEQSPSSGGAVASASGLPGAVSNQAGSAAALNQTTSSSLVAGVGASLVRQDSETPSPSTLTPSPNANDRDHDGRRKMSMMGGGTAPASSAVRKAKSENDF